MNKYYHVLIYTKQNTARGEVKVDLDEAELQERFIQPYESGESIIINGKTVLIQDLDRIKISVSEEPSSSIIGRIKAEDRISSIAILGGPSYESRAAGRAKDVTDSFIKAAPGSKSPKNKKSKTTKSVFIVHGHDDLAKNETARFVESLGFKAIILHEQASKGCTIIEKIEAYSDVCFGLILYTPDDLGRVRVGSRRSLPRARQNVVFEHGYLIGKLGRQHVTALVKSSVEKPNDVSGVVYVEMDSKGSWKLELAKEMKAAGLSVDLNHVI